MSIGIFLLSLVRIKFLRCKIKYYLFSIVVLYLIEMRSLTKYVVIVNNVLTLPYFGTIMFTLLQ